MITGGGMKNGIQIFLPEIATGHETGIVSESKLDFM